MPTRSRVTLIGIVTAALTLAVALWPITLDETPCGAPLRAITYPPSPCQEAGAWHLLIAVGVTAAGAIIAVTTAARNRQR
jgi:hypothetical protein